jgi:hypothetical protein
VLTVTVMWDDALKPSITCCNARLGNLVRIVGAEGQRGGTWRGTPAEQATNQRKAEQRAGHKQVPHGIKSQE